MGMAAWGAYAQQPVEGMRDVTLKITDRRGRPVQGIVVESTVPGSASITDRNGVHIFSRMTERDSISMLLPRYGETVIPVSDMDSIVVALRNARQFNYYDAAGERTSTDGYTVVKEKDRTQSASSIDVQEILKTSNYNSLIDLLSGRVAGLDINPATGAATIRGSRSFTGSNEPLVILNGVDSGTLSEVSAMINLRDIKTIDIVKEGAMYGSRGANGVIVITMMH